MLYKILLQRTKADQVVPVFNNFKKQFPTAALLAEATEAKILEVIKPLGLAWRSRFLKQLGSSIKDGIPENSEDLKKLPGVGPYVAGAYLSLHRKKRSTIIDSNVVRLYGRFFGFVITAGIIREIRRQMATVRIEKVPDLILVTLVSTLSSLSTSSFSLVTIGAWISYSLFSLGIGTLATHSGDPTYSNLISTYLWHLVNVIPLSNVEMSFGMKEPIVQFVGWVSGIPFLAFRLFVVVIIFGTIRDLWRIFNKQTEDLPTERLGIKDTKEDKVEE